MAALTPEQKEKLVVRAAVGAGTQGLSPMAKRYYLQLEEEIKTAEKIAGDDVVIETHWDF